MPIVCNAGVRAFFLSRFKHIKMSDVSRPSTAGIVNFGGLITRAGQFLRANGTTRSTLSTTAGHFADFFYVAEPMQLDTCAWTVPNRADLLIEFEILVNGTSAVISQVTGPSVTKMMAPLILNRGDLVQVAVRDFRRGVPSPSLLSMYMMPH